MTSSYQNPLPPHVIVRHQFQKRSPHNSDDVIYGQALSPLLRQLGPTTDLLILVLALLTKELVL